MYGAKYSKNKSPKISTFMLRFPSEALTDALSEANMALKSNAPLLWQAKAATEVSQKSKMSANGV